MFCWFFCYFVKQWILVQIRENKIEEHLVMEQASVLAADTRRKILQMAVSTILIDIGFDAVEKDALETLVEMFQTSELVDFILWRHYTIL